MIHTYHNGISSFSNICRRIVIINSDMIISVFNVRRIDLDLGVWCHFISDSRQMCFSQYTVLDTVLNQIDSCQTLIDHQKDCSGKALVFSYIQNRIQSTNVETKQKLDCIGYIPS